MRRSSGIVVLALTSALLGLPAVAHAAPADVTSPVGSVGDHAALLSWTGGGTAGAVVRDVTGLTPPFAPTDGLAVASSGATAKDTHFLNTVTRTYAIWAKDADGTTSPNAATVDVAPAGPLPTALTFATSRSVGGYGQSYTAAGTLTRAGVPSPNMPVRLLSRVVGTSAFAVGRNLTTDASGYVKTTLITTRNVELYLAYAGDLFSSAATSPHKVVKMQPTSTATFNPNSIVRTESTVVRGHVPPGLPDSVVYVQRRAANGTWGTFKVVRPNSHGDWAWTYTPAGSGNTAWRALLPGRASYLTAVSGTRTLSVGLRNLVLGNTGNDVLSLERYLASKKYLPGKVDGTFDKNTLHAVITFEKVEGLPRIGKWTKAERTRSSAPRGYRLKYPTTGRAFEVDIARQVVVWSEHGVIQLIVDTSTGGEYRYTYEGGSDIAHTPRGSFKIQRKIDGVRTSKLGYLYRPSYFVGGFALHGEAYDVPVYPASHGCVRLTNYVTDLLFSKLTIGTPVHIF
jgi:lipoprotein-anchoring transpeptidase ErfK/SrfK